MFRFIWQEGSELDCHSINPAILCTTLSVDGMTWQFHSRASELTHSLTTCADQWCPSLSDLDLLSHYDCTWSLEDNYFLHQHRNKTFHTLVQSHYGIPRSMEVPWIESSQVACAGCGITGVNWPMTNIMSKPWVEVGKQWVQCSFWE